MTVFSSGRVSGYLHTPVEASQEGLILTHGAGGNSESPLLVSIANQFASAGMYVLRYDLPFRQKRRSGPPFGDGLADRRGLSEAAAELRKLVRGAVYVGGHSYGGRQASILAVEESGLCDGLLLLSYPLHPPKQPELLRTGHFANLQRPTLFVHGARDPFASGSELRAAVRFIPSPTAISVVENSGDDLNKGAFDLQHTIVLPFAKLMTARNEPE